MIATWLAALVLAYVPGALLFRLPGQSRPFRASLPAEERVFWAVVLSALWSTTVVLALGSIGQYSFNRLLVTNSVVSLAILVGARGRLLYGGTARQPGWQALIPVAIVGLACWLYFPASEYVIGGKDPGTYLNEGIQIAQRGRLIGRDAIVAAVPAAFRDLFFPMHRGMQELYYGIRFMGFFIEDPAAGTVVGQFPHMFPASIAMGYGLNGLTGAREAIGIWAILGLLAVYFAANRLFGRLPATVATLLLATNVIEVWFARYPNSEMTMQALVFTAMLALTYALDGHRTFFGTIAGLALGSMLFLRYEIALAVVTFIAAALLAPLAKQRVGKAFKWWLGLTFAAGFIYLAWPMRAYAAYPAEFLRQLGGWWLAPAGAVAIVATWLLLKIQPLARAIKTGLPLVLAISLVGLAVYAYFFRQEAGRVALGDAIAFRAFGWYVTPMVLAAAVAGWAVLVFKRFWTAPVFYLTVGFFSVFFFYKMRIVPEHFWASRRFLAVALPGALILAAALVDWLVGPAAIGRLLRSTRPGDPLRLSARIAGTAFVLALASPAAVAYWRQSAPVRAHVEYAGVIPELERLTGRIGDNDLVIVESRNAGSDLHTLGLPLAYIYARNVLVLDSPTPIKRLFDDFVLWADTAYDRVLFLGGGGTDLLTRRVRATPIVSHRFSVPEYESVPNAYPSGVRRKDFEFGLYELVQSAGAAPTLPIALQIGALDDLNVVRFYARETRGDTGLAFRWTGAQSFVLIPAVPASAKRLTIWLGHGGRPPSVPAPVVEVAFADVVVGTAVPENAPAPFTFDLPADTVRAVAETADPVRLRLRVPTWNPNLVLGAPDTRNLGVMVTRVEVE